MTIYLVIDAEGTRAFSDYEKAKQAFDIACEQDGHEVILKRKTI